MQKLPLKAHELESLGLIKKTEFNNGSKNIRTWFPLRGYWNSGSGIFENVCFAPTSAFQSDESVEDLSWQKDMFNGFWGKYLNL